MKLAIVLTFLVSISSAFSSNTNQADWIVEAGVLLLSGQAAIDLFESLHAKETLHPLSTKYHEVRTKKNKFADCIAEYERGDTLEDFILTKANCKIKAPTGTVFKY